MKKYKNTYKEKITWLNGNYKEVEPLAFYEAIFPKGSFQLKGERYTNKANGMIVSRSKDKRIHTEIVYDDRSEIEKVIKGEGIYDKHEFAFMAPVTFVGRRRINDNAIKAYAIVLDIDDVDVNGLKWIINTSINLVIFPVPTYVVVSGNGVHIYYVFNDPVPLYDQQFETLDMLKHLLTAKIWCQYSSHDPRVQFQPITQAYRMPGSRTKNGRIAKAYQTGAKIDIENLICCLSNDDLIYYRHDKFSKSGEKYFRLRQQLNEYRNNPQKAFADFASICYSSNHVSLENAKELYPLWYQRRIIEGQSRGHYTSPQHLYYWWLDRMKKYVSYHHRYYCILVLVSYATKCQIPYDNVKKDAYDMLDMLDSLTPNGAQEKEHFTDKDIEHALSMYGQDLMYRFSNAKIAYLTGIPQPEKAKRNKQSRTTHLQKCSDKAVAVKKLHPEINKGGRPSKEAIIREYLRQHPNEKNISKISKECHLSRTTIYKYLKGDAA